MKHLSADELQAGLEEVLRSPRDAGLVRMIVRRPEPGRRQTLAQGELDPAEGLVGDNWSKRGDPDPKAQLTIMNARVIALVAGSEEHWPPAGDQLYVDMDLGKDHLPGGARLRVGEAVVEVSAGPHLGCRKFAARFGTEAMKFVNSGLGKRRCFRGINARIVAAGLVRVGDRVTKLPDAAQR